jgi:hypothetical protein
MMKRKMFLCAALCAGLLVALMAAGCKSAPAGVDDPAMPPWINDRPPAGELWGVGVANNAQMQMRMTMADSRARQDLARQLQTLAQGMVVDYARDAGGIDNTVVLLFQETVSRQIVDAKLVGAVQDVMWNTPDRKTLWIRLKMSKEDAARNAEDQILKAVESEAARYAEFKAMEALKLMDQQLEKNHPAPLPVTR